MGRFSEEQEEVLDYTASPGRSNVDLEGLDHTQLAIIRDYLQTQDRIKVLKDRLPEIWRSLLGEGAVAKFGVEYELLFPKQKSEIAEDVLDWVEAMDRERQEDRL